MRMYRLLLVLTLGILAVGCVPATEPAQEEEVLFLCGPNEVVHAGLGVEPHCHCADGYERFDGECIPEGSREPDEPDMSSTEPPPTQDLPRSLPLACWLPPGSFCDPRNPTMCNLNAGETCDVAESQTGAIHIACLPGPNTQGLGDSCDPSAGSFCSHGLRCVEPGICKSFCCDSSECDPGNYCKPMSDRGGTLGVCTEGMPDVPQCARPGAFCQQASDCCSRDCHVGHCH